MEHICTIQNFFGSVLPDLVHICTKCERRTRICRKFAGAGLADQPGPLYLRSSRYRKYGAPISAAIVPAAMPSGSAALRPIVSAASSSQPPIRIAIGMDS